MREPVVILGGGLAGLSAAYHLNGQAALYEQRTSLGGLCSQLIVDQFRFDAVPHVLHFQRADMFGLVQQLLGGRLRSYHRHARVYSHGTYTRYPFQAHLFGLPPAVIQECVQGRLAVAHQRPEIDTFERWVTTTFGEGIAKHFMVPYNTKFWTVPPSELTCEWLDGMVPVPTCEQTVAGAFVDDPAEYGYNVEFWYPSAGGLGGLFEAFLQRLPRVQLGKRLVQMDTQRRRLCFSDGDIVEYDQLLCSIPMPELKPLLEPLPEEVARAFDALRWTSLAVVHLGVRGAAPVPWHWVYVPEDAFLFYRVGIPSHYAPDAAPEGCHAISAEISCSAWRNLEQAHLVPRVIENLLTLGLLRAPEDVIAQRPLILRYGYPIYDHNYVWATGLIRSYLREQGIEVMGRFGSWQYLSMEATLLSGQRAAQQLSATRVDHGALLR